MCNLNVRMIKLREFKGTVAPCVMILFRNNVMRMMTRDNAMRWRYNGNVT